MPKLRRRQRQERGRPSSSFLRTELARAAAIVTAAVAAAAAAVAKAAKAAAGKTAEAAKAATGAAPTRRMQRGRQTGGSESGGGGLTGRVTRPRRRMPLRQKQSFSGSSCRSLENIQVLRERSLGGSVATDVKMCT
ncbi:unnamed protein product [Phaeothamnion confervicola]